MNSPQSSTFTFRAPVVGIAALLTVAAVTVARAQDCRPTKPLPAVVADTALMGPCTFSLETLSFLGTPTEQAQCTLRQVKPWGHLGPRLVELPPVLAERIGRSDNLPTRETLSGYLSRLDLETDFAAYLWRPVSHAQDNDPDAPVARYFVLHDTSSPHIGRAEWPADIDQSPHINSLARYLCSDGWERAHVVVNRSGAMLLGHEFEIPWRATKLERAIGFGQQLKGLFLHVELVQPRRPLAGRGSRNDGDAPSPGFTEAQYDRLALLYMTVSVRAGTWLIPATHAAIDGGLRDGHDDPQNFNLATFSLALERLVDALNRPPPIIVTYDQ